MSGEARPPTHLPSNPERSGGTTQGVAAYPARRGIEDSPSGTARRGTRSSGLLAALAADLGQADGFARGVEHGSRHRADLKVSTMARDCAKTPAAYNVNCYNVLQNRSQLKGFAKTYPPLTPCSAPELGTIWAQTRIPGNSLVGNCLK